MTAAGVTHRRRRPWLWPTIVVVAVLVVGGAAVGVRALLHTDPGIWPADGTAKAVSVNGVGGGTLEQAVLTSGGVQRIGRLGELATSATPDAARWLRVGVTPVGSPTNLVFTVSGGRARLAGFELPDGGLALSPTLELATPGTLAAAHQSGRAQTLLAEQAFDAAIRSSQTGDCASTSGELTAPQPLGAVQLAITICTGQGVTQFAVTSNVGQLIVQPDPAAQPREPLDVRAEQPQLTDPTGWRARTRKPYQNGGFGPQLPPTGGLLRPVLRVDGGLAAIDPQSGDVIAFARPAAATRVRLDWRGHPGGAVTQLLGAGDLVVAATDAGRVVGYGPTGVRVWASELAGEPVALGLTDGRLVVALHDGTLVRLDPQSGKETQRSSLGATLDPPVSVAAGRLLVHAGDQVAAYDLATDQRSWTRPVSGLLDLAGDQLTVAVASADATTALAAVDGRVRWQGPGADLVIAANGRVVGAGGTTVSALGAQGVVASWDLLAEINGLVAGPDGLVVTTADGLTWLE